MALLALWPIVAFATVILFLGWLVRRWNARDEERFRRDLDRPRALRSLPPELLPPPSRERPPSERTRSR